MKTRYQTSPWLISLVLTAACFIIYSPALRGRPLWDDEAHLFAARTLSLSGLTRIWLHPETAQQYYPLTSTVFWIGGFSPLGFHILNVILHSANAILVAFLFKKLGSRSPWCGAFLFALHPVHVESVAWISELKNTQSAFFYLLALILYLRFMAEEKWPVYMLSLSFYICALFSKTVASSFTPVVLLLLLYQNRRWRWKDFGFLVPFAFFGLLLGAKTAYLERIHVGAEGRLWNLSFYQRAGIAGRAIGFYVGKLLWPHPLMFIYPRWNPEQAPGIGAVALGLAGILIYLAWFFRKRVTLTPFVAWSAFLIILLPALGFFNLYPMKYSFVADHFQYLASVPLIGLFAEALNRFFTARKIRPGIQTVFITTFALGLGLTSWQRAYAFQNPLALWTDTLSKNPNSAMAHNNLACELIKQGDIQGAKRQALESIRLDPRELDAQLTVGDLYFHYDKNLDLALEHYQWAYQEAQQLAPTPGALVIRSDIQTYIADVLREKNRLKEAEGFLEGALHDLTVLALLRSEQFSTEWLDYHEAKINDNLALVLSLQKKYSPAVDALRRAVIEQPLAAPLHLHLATVLQAAGQTHAAITAYQQTLTLDPNYWPTYQQLAGLLRQTGNPEAAAKIVRDAVRCHPEWKISQ